MYKRCIKLYKVILQVQNKLIEPLDWSYLLFAGFLKHIIIQYIHTLYSNVYIYDLVVLMQHFFFEKAYVQQWIGAVDKCS